MDVGDWLRGLGLAQYEALFRENDIDTEVLAELTESDLTGLGVSLGHRKRLLKAIANLGSTETSAKPATSSPPQASLDTAERRQLTVMFCDLVGSTALSARLDPEDMRRVIRAYQDAVSGVVARYDGFVAKFMGDGVLAYFGFPRAHEDDAARAVHAGLEIAQGRRGAQNPGARKARRADRGRDRASSSSATSSAKARRRSRPSSATRPISRRGCRVSLTPAGSSSPPRRGGWSATASG